MEEAEFHKYLSLAREPFKIFPAPRPRDHNEDVSYFRCAKFVYVEHNSTHVKVQDNKTEKFYNVPFVLVEFLNPGVMRLSRVVEILEGSFV